MIAKEREKLDGYAEAKSKLIEQQAVIAALVILPPLPAQARAFYPRYPLALPRSRCY